MEFGGGLALRAQLILILFLHSFALLRFNWVWRFTCFNPAQAFFIKLVQDYCLPRLLLLVLRLNQRLLGQLLLRLAGVVIPCELEQALLHQLGCKSLPTSRDLDWTLHVFLSGQCFGLHFNLIINSSLEFTLFQILNAHTVVSHSS